LEADWYDKEPIMEVSQKEGELQWRRLILQTNNHNQPIAVEKQSDDYSLMPKPGKYRKNIRREKKQATFSAISVATNWEFKQRKNNSSTKRM
jgi:hypothetical protein